MSKKTNADNVDLNDSLIFESVIGQENLVKAISFNEGKKQEVYVYVISEEQFENLIPSEEKGKNHLKSLVLD